jgi:hypothetical protein
MENREGKATAQNRCDCDARDGRAGAVRQGQQVLEFAYTPAPRVQRRFDELPETSRLTANSGRVRVDHLFAANSPPELRNFSQHFTDHQIVNS